MKSIFICLLLAVICSGCASKKDILYAAAVECQDQLEAGSSGSCDKEWAKWNRVEELIVRKERWRAQFDCPEGEVFVCSRSWCATSRRATVRDIDTFNRTGGKCMSQHSANNKIDRANRPVGLW